MTDFDFDDCKDLFDFEDALMSLDQIDCDEILNLFGNGSIDPIPGTSVGGELCSQSGETNNPSEENNISKPTITAPQKRGRPSSRCVSPPRKRLSIKDIREEVSCSEMFSDPDAFGGLSKEKEGGEEENQASTPDRLSRLASPENNVDFDGLLNKLSLSMQRSELSRQSLTQQQPQPARITKKAGGILTGASNNKVSSSSAHQRMPQVQTLYGLSGFLNGTRPTLTTALEQSRKQLRAYMGSSIRKTL